MIRRMFRNFLDKVRKPTTLRHGQQVQVPQAFDVRGSLVPTLLPRRLKKKKARGKIVALKRSRRRMAKESRRRNRVR